MDDFTFFTFASDGSYEPIMPTLKMLSMSVALGVSDIAAHWFYPNSEMISRIDGGVGAEIILPKDWDFLLAR